MTGIVFTRLPMVVKAAAKVCCARGGAQREATRRTSAMVGIVGLLAVLGTSGCDQIRGRRLIQEGNAAYREGDYKKAVKLFDEAAKHLPDFPTLHLNKGFTCKQLVIPGSKTPESIVGANCAIASFKRYMELKPDEPKGEMLLVQTLFDADRFATLAEMYEERYAANPKDSQAVATLMQVYSKWEKMDEALKWYQVNLDLRPTDAEAFYAAGTFIYNQLLIKGGAGDKQMWDPRPGAINANPPPEFREDDIQGQQRIDLAEAGIKYLEKAVELRPTYTDAMAYINLLWRQKSFAYFNQPTEWQAAVNKSEEWARKTMAVMNHGQPVAAAPAEAAEAEPAAGKKPAGKAAKNKPKARAKGKK